MKNLNQYSVSEIKIDELKSITGGSWIKRIGKAIGWFLADLANYGDYVDENQASVHGATRFGEF